MAVTPPDNIDGGNCSGQNMEIPLINVSNKSSDHSYSIKDAEEDTSVPVANANNLKVRHIKCWIDDLSVSEKYYYSCTLCGTEKFTFNNLSTHIKKKCLLTGFLLKESEKGEKETLKRPSKKPRTEIVRFFNKSPKEKKSAVLNCRVCDKTFFYLSTLKLHMKTHQSRPKFLCITCGRSYYNRSNLLEHTKTHADEPASCTLCGVTYRNTIMLKTHMMSHTGTHPYQCDRCDDGFLFENDLKKHLKQEHDYVQRDFQCPTCKKMFTSTVRLSLHQSAYCKKTSGSVPLVVVKSSAVSATPQSTWLCSICGKSFGARPTMLFHEKSVHGEEVKKQTCTICKKSFPYRGQFRRHMKWHQGTEKLTCDICGWLCSPGASLRGHLMTHSDQRPFECQCGSSFKRSSHLRVHKKSVHNMTLSTQCDKPRHFSCYICGETFEGRKEQKNHTEIHHPPDERALTHNIDQSLESTQLKQLGYLKDKAKKSST